MTLTLHFSRDRVYPTPTPTVVQVDISYFLISGKIAKSLQQLATPDTCISQGGTSLSGRCDELLLPQARPVIARQGKSVTLRNGDSGPRSRRNCMTAIFSFGFIRDFLCQRAQQSCSLSHTSSFPENKPSQSCRTASMCSDYTIAA